MLQRISPEPYKVHIEHNGDVLEAKCSQCGAAHQRLIIIDRKSVLCRSCARELAEELLRFVEEGI